MIDLLGLLDVGCLGECINIIYLDLSANKISSVLALSKYELADYTKQQTKFNNKNSIVNVGLFPS